jgi:dihydrofolate synthase/folylpolyglutamate synthase
MTCALKGASIPGRFEVIAGNPPLILDGAHNPAGCRRLTEALREEFPEDRATVVFAALSDKDVSAMVDALAPIVDRFVATEVPGTDRALSADELAAIMRKRGMDVVKAEDPVVALRVARQGAPDLVLVTGSMYLVGLLRHSLARERIGV